MEEQPQPPVFDPKKVVDIVITLPPRKKPRPKSEPEQLEKKEST